jgi:hypothetical protein
MALFAKSQKFEEQCFFTDFIADFATLGGVQYYDNFIKATLPSTSDTSKFFNKLTVPEGLDAFLNISPAQAASLVPYIRIYKVYYPDPESQGIDYELTFENFITQDAIESITNDRTGRGGGAGVKSFSWENRGESMATADKIFEAKLDLVFQDMNSLSQNRTVISVDRKTKQTFSWLDLVVPQEKYKSLNTNNRVWNDKYFRTKITVGWAVPDTISDSSISFSEAEKEAIRKSGRTFFLNLVTHELSFSDVGQINLSITYQANTESVLGSPEADVLLFKKQPSPAQEELKRLKEQLNQVRRDKSAIGSDECKGSFTDDSRENIETNISDKEKEILDQIEAKRREIRATRYQRFMTYLFDSGAIKTIDVPADFLESYVNGERPEKTLKQIREELGSSSGRGFSSNVTAQKVKLEDTVLEYVREGDADEARDSLNSAFLGDVEDGKQRLVYTFFGNILNAGLFAINDGRTNEIRTICGMVNVKNPRTEKDMVINLADIPVSMKMFTAWFFDVCISKELSSWRFKKFINDVIEQLFRSVVKGKCFERDDVGTGGDLDLKLETLDLPVKSLDSPVKSITGQTGRDPILNLPWTGMSPSTITWNKWDGSNSGRANGPLPLDAIPDPTADVDYTSTNIVSYLLIYAKHTRPEEFQYPNPSGREAEDRRRKVYHLRVGRNRGLVKNINFSRVDQPYAKEARLVASVEENDRILAVRELYDADITLYGNTIWSPGSLFYVDLSSWFGGRTKNENDDLDIAVKMGLQAYYRVISTSSFIENGKYEVQIKGKYEFSGVKKIDDEVKDGAPEKECPDVSKYDTNQNPTTLSDGTTVGAGANLLEGAWRQLF